MVSRRLLVIPLGAAFAAALLAAPVVAATYKWVDEKGAVHYSDKMPPEAVEKASVELNKQGIAVKRIEPAPTLEQRRAKQAEEERLKITSREREMVDRRDRALLQSYTSEDEIDLARNRALGTLDTQVASAQAYSAQLVKRRQELETKRRAFGAKPVPPALDTELEGIAREVTKQDVFIAERKRDSATITLRYDQDKFRWRELRTLGEAKDAAAGASPATGSVRIGAQPVASSVSPSPRTP